MVNYICYIFTACLMQLVASGERLIQKGQMLNIHISTHSNFLCQSRKNE